MKDTEYLKKEGETQKNQIEAIFENSDKSIIDQTAKIELLNTKVNEMEIIIGDKVESFKETVNCNF